MLLQWCILNLVFCQAVMGYDGLFECVWRIPQYVWSQAIMVDALCMRVCM